MKKITFLALFIGLFCTTLSNAQVIPPTGGGVASANPPASWIGATASTSNKTLYQGNAAKPWKNGSVAAVPGQANATFLSLYSNNSVITETYTTITGLTAGWYYDFSYYVMTASATTPAGQTDFAYAAEVAVEGTNSFVQYSFNAANSSVWIPGTIQFKAAGTTAKLKFRTLGQSAKGSVANLSISAGALKEVCGANPQVDLSKASLYNKCFQPYVNLNDAFTGVVPQGSSVVWFGNNTHSGWAVIEPKKVTVAGDYYAFFYNGSCYNTNLSTAKVTVSIHPPLPGDGQVMLNKAALTNECPVTATVDLTTAFTSPLPLGAIVRWFNNPTHSGVPVADPTKASALVSKYYAFFYDVAFGCYNTDNSTAVEIVSKRPCLQQMSVQWLANDENSNAKSDIIMYPNPVSDKIQIGSFDFDEISEVRMYNTEGLLVYKSEAVPSSTIDVKHLRSGTYVVKIARKNGVAYSYKVQVRK